VSILDHLKVNLTVKNPDFNTTLVSVLVGHPDSPRYAVYGFQYNACVGSSIKERYGGVTLPEFQYNACVGSSFSKYTQ